MVRQWPNSSTIVLAGTSPSNGCHQYGSVLRNLLQIILQQIFFVDAQIQKTWNRIHARTASATITATVIEYSSHQSESSSSTGMIRQHNYNNNNNNNDNGANKRGGSGPTAKPNASESSLSSEQMMPLNLVSTPPGTLTTTTTTIMGQQQMDSGMALSCDMCQRPFQSAYLLHMHRTYFHNQPPPGGWVDEWKWHERHVNHGRRQSKR